MCVRLGVNMRVQSRADTETSRPIQPALHEYKLATEPALNAETVIPKWV